MKRFLQDYLPWPIATLIIIFVLLGASYSVANPLHEATDELRHFRFVRYVAVNKRLPVQAQEPCRSQSHHPPLIYVVGALATSWVDGARDICYTPPENPFWNYRYWEVGVDNKSQYLHGADEAFPWYGDALIAHIVRFINVLVGAGVVWLTWGTGRVIWPRRRLLPLAAAALVAFNPMFVYLSAAINNDIIAAFSGTAILYAVVRFLSDDRGLSRGWGIAFGSIFGLALLSKLNLAAFALPIALAMTWTAWRKNQWRPWLEAVIWCGVMSGLIAGWWFVRNLVLYDDLTGFRVLTELWGVRDPAESLPLVISEFPYAWTTLWGRFGFGQIPLPEWIYLGLRWGIGLALLGWLVPLVKRATGRANVGTTQLASGQGNLVWGHVLLVTLIAGGVWFNYMLVSPAGAMGRFFFPGLPALALLVTAGLFSWLDLLQGHVSRRSIDWGAAGITIGAFATLALVALVGFLRPAYARPAGFDASTPIPNETNAQFDFFANLRGYEISNTRVKPGEPIQIDLYWEVTGKPPGNYLLFVHLIDDNELMVSQRDTHPGLGRYPSSEWVVGDQFIESFALYVPETAYTPGAATLSIGLWVQDAYRVGITDGNGAFIGDSLPLADIEIEALSPELPNMQATNFEDQLLLTGYRYNSQRLAPGEQLEITLHWEALVPLNQNYLVRLELIDETGNLRAREHQHLWPDGVGQPAGTRWSYTYFLELADDLESGSYLFRIGLINSERNALLNTLGESGNWIEVLVDLARIRIDE